MKFSMAIGTDQNALTDFIKDWLKFSIGKRSHIEFEVFLG
jgi:hypothetical protein